MACVKDICISFLEYTTHIAELLPDEGWTGYPERVDEALNVLKRVPFTVSYIT